MAPNARSITRSAKAAACSAVLGAAALHAAARDSGTRTTFDAAILLTLAIVSHHFTAMGAVEIVPDPTRSIHGLTLAPTSLSLASKYPPAKPGALGLEPLKAAI